MSASIWDPNGTIESTVNADLTLMSQRFTATAGQTIFTLTDFQYQPLSQSLLVEINGASQFLDIDYTETSATAVTTTTPCNAGDIVVIRGFVGGDAAQAALVALQAAAVILAATIFPASDVSPHIKNSVDATKLGQFDVSGVPAGTTVTLSFPTASGELALTADVLALANSLGTAAFTAVTDYAPAAGSVDIVTVGTVTTGTWNGDIVAGQFGGTGVDNTGKTVTLGGNLETAGAFNTTITVTADTNVTLPVAGTLALTTQALDTFGAPTDVTTNNATVAAHGLLSKLSGTVTDVLKGDGTFGPASGAAAANIYLALNFGGF